MPDLNIGTRLRLIDPEPPITAAIDGHKRPNLWTARPESCTRCAECVGLPEGSDHPWSEIAVIGWDSGAGTGELIVQPITFSTLSSPRRLHVDDLLDLYEVVIDGAPASGWATPLEEGA